MGLLISTATMASTSHVMVFDCRSPLGNLGRVKKILTLDTYPERNMRAWTSIWPPHRVMVAGAPLLKERF